MCDCGVPTFMRMGQLTSSPNPSCGHAKGNYKHGASKNSNATKHGLSNSRLYNIWCGMRYRCYNTDSPAYHHYGGRGIVMCDDWYDDYASFERWALSSGYDNELSIDRVDVNEGYAPSNCRWATRAEQADNRRNATSVDAWGDSKSLKAWSRDSRCLVGYPTLYNRIVLSGWDAEKAISTPARGRG
jgi:hypothetical protein